MIYYWELQEHQSFGQFEAESDEEAFEKAIEFETPNNRLIVLYKESDTKNGMPFITVYSNESLPVI